MPIKSIDISGISEIRIAERASVAMRLRGGIASTAALVNAEELGVTKANVQDMAKSSNPEIKRFLGQEGKFGEAMGLSNDWVMRIVLTVGNYGESFERYLGAGSRLKLQRGPNALWTKGGLQYSPPFR